MSNFIIAMGEYPSPITAALNRSFIEEHLSTSEPIRLMVAAIARAQQNVTNVEQVEPLNVTDAKTIDQSILRSHLMSLSLEPDEGVSETTLLYFVLLCIYETMVDATGLGFLSVVEQMSELLRKHPPKPSATNYHTKCLLVVLELMRAVRALILDEDVSLYNAGLYEKEAFETGNADCTTRDMYFLQTLCAFLNTLARTNAWSRHWTSQARSVAREATPTPDWPRWRDALERHGYIETGQRVVAEGRRAYELLNDLYEGRDDATVSVASEFISLSLSCYRYGLISLARLFMDPLWTLVDVRPPVGLLTLDFEGLASTALLALERRLPFAGAVESLLFLPFLLVAALEIKNLEDKARVLALYRAISAKGFIVAETYISDIEMVWKLADTMAIHRTVKYTTN